MLSKNWITEHNLDSEYKRYVLLGYLKMVSNKFDQSLLYPHFSELSDHYTLLQELVQMKRDLQSNFPKTMNGIDWQKMQALYEGLIEDSSVMAAVQEIIDYAMPKMHACLEDGRTVYSFYKEQLYLESIGIAPLYDDEGYLLLLNIGDNCTMAYRYNITIYDHPAASYKKVNTEYLGSYETSISNTEEYIKRSLVKDHAELPNPATYSIKTEIPIPIEETLLPISKQVLGEYLDNKPRAIN